MKKLLVTALVAAFTISAAPGDQVTCNDGRVVTDNRTSPFQPDPCAVTAEPLEPTEEDIGFLMAFGPPPQPTQNSLRDRIARAQYAQDRRVFRGLIEPPAEWSKFNEFFNSYGFGAPVFFANVYGKYVRYPDAPFGTCTAPLSSAVLSPGLMVAKCQSAVVLEGACIPVLHHFVPGWVREENLENCGVASEEEKP